MLVAACGDRDAPHAEAASLPVVVIIVTGRGHSPLKALFAPLVAAFDSLLGAVSGHIGRCFLVAARCRLSASQCRVNHGCLVAGGALDGDAAWLLKCAPEEVVMSTLPRALGMASRQYARATLVSLVANLWFVVLSLPLPWRGLG
jgi:hypothetical protein